MVLDCFNFNFLFQLMDDCLIAMAAARSQIERLEIADCGFTAKGLKYLRMVILFKHNFSSSHNVPRENPGGTRVIVGSMNMGYVSITTRNRINILVLCSARS